MSDPLIRFQGVMRTFEDGRVVALDNVTLEIERGEFVAVMGPSGSGKTTLLNLMGAMDLPTAGDVSVDGIRLTDKKTLDRVRSRSIGFVFQMHHLISVLNAAENVEIPMIPRNGSKRERRKRSLALLDQVGLKDRARTNVRVLSGGERQRVAIARAMANEPPLLLADEPTGNLDSKTGLEVMGVLHDLRKRTGAALVLVTHNKEICKGCDRMLRMLDGRVEE